MQKEHQNYLKEQLSALDTNERLKLYRKASAMRKQQQARKRPREDETPFRTKPLDEYVLQLLLQDANEEDIGTATGQGDVVWLGPKTCQVSYRDSNVDCQIPRSLSVAVGDRVTFGQKGDGHSIVSVQPRVTVLSRPDVDNGRVERVIAANIDIVVVVVSVVAPPLHPRIIDRYMVAIQRGGARMVLAVNKIDLLVDENRDLELSKLEPYRGVAATVFCSTHTGAGIDNLRNLLSNQTCVFVGHSGVGKSSLVNAFDPSLGVLTRSVSEGYGRGTHTTTSSTLHLLHGGTKVIDTPGIRSFGLWDISKSDLAWYFPEFEEYQADCRFRDCSHSHEPCCGVKNALARGQISQARYEAYMRILTFP